MVRIQVKVKQELDEKERQFLYDCPSTTGIDEIATTLIEMSNLQFKIHRLFVALELWKSWSNQPGNGGGNHSNEEALPLMRDVIEAKSYASMDQVFHARPLSLHILRYHVETIEKQVMANEAMGLSHLTQLHQLLSSSCKDSDFLQKDTTQLVWAGKELMKKSKRLRDYVGDNDKTKIILRLQPSCLSSA